jgi:hypothetical protein
MNQETMTFDAVSTPLYHGRGLDRRVVASQAIPEDDIPALIGEVERCRVGAQCLVEKVSDPRLRFVPELRGDAGIGHMAFGACKLFMLGFLPLAAHMFHAVAGHAEAGTARGVITCRRDDDKEDADEDSSGKKYP